MIFRSRPSSLVFHAAVFIVAGLIVISRRPDIVLNPQFFAEDGKYWYANAYHSGLHSLLAPQAGYLNTLTRLIALLSLLFPLSIAPLVMNICALVVQLLPVNLFLSSRFASISLRFRLAASFLYLALPNTFELDATITNLQWHLALAALLVLLGSPASNCAWCVFDAMVLVLISIDGPMGILLVPIAAVLWHKKPAIRSKMITLALLLSGALIQAITILFHSRPANSNGASLSRLISILGRQVFLASLLGMNSVYRIMRMHSSFTIEVTVTVLGLSILLYGLWRAPLEVKLVLSFAAMVFAAALTHPLANPTGPQWEYLRIPGCGTRYYFFPMIAFLTTLVWIAVHAPPQKLHYIALAALFMLPIGIYRDWRYPKFVDFHFREYAMKFEDAPRGTQVTIPINPPGWSMQLTKR
jgi:hypothetical protein